MKSILYFSLLILGNSMNLFGQFYSGPIPKPTISYGAEGSFTVSVESFPNPNYPLENIRIFHPSESTSSVPTIFYSHGFGGYDPVNILGLLNFVARKGYAIVFVPYQTSGVTSDERYHNLLSGFTKSARDFPNIIDTTKVGFMGHSFGGGATFANSYHCFTNLNWGLSGRFLFASAQWYSLNISQDELLNFPNDVKLISMVYENDITNDHRMANDIFNTINIPPSEKDFLLVKSDTVDSYIYEAIHGVPNTASAFDALDYYAIYRHLDALCDYTFNGNLTAKDVALGNGSTNQILMPGGLSNLEQSDFPNFSMEDSLYTYLCNTWQNPRQEYCNITNSIVKLEKVENNLIYPNPCKDVLTVNLPNKELDIVKIIDFNGKIMKIGNSNSISISDLDKGMFFIEIYSQNIFFRSKFVKN